MIFAIDFDGTIVQDRYPKIGKLNPKAAQFIQELHRLGHTFILWTNRTGRDLDMAVCFLRAVGLKPDYVNENTPENVARYENDSRKIFADMYIDDRNSGGVVWPFNVLAWRSGK